MAKNCNHYKLEARPGGSLCFAQRAWARNKSMIIDIKTLIYINDSGNADWIGVNFFGQSRVEFNEFPDDFVEEKLVHLSFPFFSNRLVFFV